MRNLLTTLLYIIPRKVKEVEFFSYSVIYFMSFDLVSVPEMVLL